MTSDETIIFVHIPKTAGTTLHTIIDRQYPRRASHFMDRHEVGVREFRALSDARRAEIRMLRGHIPYGLHEYCPLPVRYFTLLRDPIDRVASYFYFVQREPAHYRYDFANEPGMTLARYAESHTSLQTDNFQTRLVSGVWTDLGYGELDRAILEQAKANLSERFAVVGLTERFDESLILLKRAFQWRGVYYARHNVTQERPPKAAISAETLAVVREHNQLDIELYEHAKALFGRQIEAQGPDLAEELDRFCRTNQRLQPLLRLYWRARQVSVRALLREILDRSAGQDRTQEEQP
jgi:hypothetical protein